MLRLVRPCRLGGAALPVELTAAVTAEHRRQVAEIRKNLMMLKEDLLDEGNTTPVATVNALMQHSFMAPFATNRSGLGLSFCRAIASAVG